VWNFTTEAQRTQSSGAFELTPKVRNQIVLRLRQGSGGHVVVVPKVGWDQWHPGLVPDLDTDNYKDFAPTEHDLGLPNVQTAEATWEAACRG